MNFTVANAFIGRVTERAVGQDVLQSLKPSEQIVKIVYDELVQLMVDNDLELARQERTLRDAGHVVTGRSGAND